MSKRYRVGIIGFAHMHINSLIQQFGAHSQVELVACADTAPERPERRDAPYRGWNRKNALEKLGVPKAYDDYTTLLSQEHCDIILCCAEKYATCRGGGSVCCRRCACGGGKADGQFAGARAADRRGRRKRLAQKSS